ncbi:hypothetical protein BK809_0007831 [Diplodia seriata]|uniref:C2H2-type domain-containing protein n=1 Tax=Diplodia seriata TaxID=420778 RepID=A0A1S8BKG3_9PEZI|nr:hypothetical protein BK809_0007831 [Diplodia seriata]
MNYQENFAFRPQGSHDSARGTRRQSCPDLLAPPALPGQGARPALSINTKAATPSKPRFACPYHKRSPGLVPKQRSCVYPGFSTIARLKEHLHRHHEQLRCTRCNECFAEEGALHNHQAARTPCEFRKYPRDYGDGFDQDQRVWLKKKKRTSDTVTDEDKWRDIYLILFPGEQAVLEPRMFP